MTSAVAILLGLVATYCLARCVVPSWRTHGVVAEAWHAVMALAMLAMVLVPGGRVPALLQVLLFTAGAAWCVAHLAARHAAGVHLRLAAGFAVMVAMLAPTAFASPASATVGAIGGVAGVGAMPGMHHADGGPSAWVVVTIAGALLLGAAALAAVLRAGDRSTRLGAGCEVVMAAGMVTMGVLALA